MLAKVPRCDGKPTVCSAMPKRTDLHTICVLGSGPIVIGQAAEFDYSGTQAVKALRADGYRVVLVNSNPATIMTDPETADATYVEPLTPDMVRLVLEKERPDALLPTVGGQTALNLAMSLVKDGTLDRLGIKLIGANAEAIERAENRQLFKQTMESIGLSCARSTICHTADEAEAFFQENGLPIVIRPSFTLGGQGGGIAYTEDEYRNLVKYGLEQSPVTEILVEESLLGWKEYEMEVVRDRNDNAIIICGIENLDPMGVHTGDSITIAPIQTLTDREYQNMRDASIAILRAVGVETGGSNVQFAVHPTTGRMVVIEMNPRVSRSSALASKATGFPIAKIAAKLAVGYTLDEITNDITRKTKAAFEPSIDYVVVKIPRFDFEKFKGASRNLTTQMKSVGEVMSMGRTFVEAFGKALRSLELGVHGLEEAGVVKSGGLPLPALPISSSSSEDAGNSVENGVETYLQTLADRMRTPTPERIWLVAAYMRMALQTKHFSQNVSENTAHTVEKLFDATKIDRWFLHHIHRIVVAEEECAAYASAYTQTKTLDAIPADVWLHWKQMGLADLRIAQLVGSTGASVRAARKAKGVVPVMKRVDTCAGEFAAMTPYLYAAYEKPIWQEGAWRYQCEAQPTNPQETGKEKVLILGGGPIRIGQGIEFDYCCVHAATSLSRAGFETIMVNCNPETVSTDYDTADRLYFEPLTLEDVCNVVDTEAPYGAIVQFGGQTPLKLSKGLLEYGLRILGTSPEAIDRAEDRSRALELVEKLGLMQPAGGTARSADAAEHLANTLGYPVLLRPSYVLGGRAMEIVYNVDELRSYLQRAVRASDDKPVLVDRFLDGAIEVDVDVLSDGKQAIVAGVMEHIEQAGIHSGDSACVLPPHTLTSGVVEQICKAAKSLALELGVVGLMNAQMAVRLGRVFIIEVNPRASRTVPFASKATGIALAPIAARLMLGASLAELGVKEPAWGRPFNHTAVKEAVLPFIKFPGVDPALGPEMRSTGEAMGIDVDVDAAFAKSQIACATKLPTTGTVLLSVADIDKEEIADTARRLSALGFAIVATSGTHRFLTGMGIPCTSIEKSEEAEAGAIERGEVNIVVNTTLSSASVRVGQTLRRAALIRGIPYFTTTAAAAAMSRAIAHLQNNQLRVRSLQEYLEHV